MCKFSGTQNEIIVNHSCPEGLLFDDTLKMCNWANLVKCSKSPDNTSSKATVITSTTIASTVIITFSTSTSSKASTPLSTTFIPNKNDKCKQGDGLYADLNSNCENYYQCIFSGTGFERIVNFSCPTGLRFDSILKICNWANQVKCDF